MAATFAFARDDGAALDEVARLDTMVTVVDAANFLAELADGDELAERGLAPYEDDERTVSDLLIDQVEFADVLVLNKLDLVDAAGADRLRGLLTRLNPQARLITSVHGRVDARDVLETGRFDLERAQQAPGWVRELNGDHIPETEEYGISSMVFRSAAAFHPGPDFVTQDLDSGTYGCVLRSKGFFTLAGREGVTGRAVPGLLPARFEPSGTRDGDVPHAQEVVFIGVGLRADALRTALAECLVAERANRHPRPLPSPAGTPERSASTSTDPCRRPSRRPADRPTDAEWGGRAGFARPLRRPHSAAPTLSPTVTEARACTERPAASGARPGNGTPF
ncbi:hypothetical protein SALBM135S_05848 [Streptomyces alboniger]